MVGLVVVLLACTAWGREKLNLSFTATPDQQLAEKLKDYPKLEWLNLHYTKVPMPTWCT